MWPDLGLHLTFLHQGLMGCEDSLRTSRMRGYEPCALLFYVLCPLRQFLNWVVLENSNVAKLASIQSLAVHSFPQEDW